MYLLVQRQGACCCWICHVLMALITPALLFVVEAGAKHDKVIGGIVRHRLLCALLKQLVNASTSTKRMCHHGVITGIL